MTNTARPGDPFAKARAVADAVLYEGYVLYPYRASARKNQLRWQFGVLAPPDHARVEGSERATMRTEVVVAADAGTRLTVRIRCLQVQHRAVERASADGFVPAEAVDVDGVVWVAWAEAVEHEIDLDPVALVPLIAAPIERAFALDAGDHVEFLCTASGELMGRARRHREEVGALVRVSARPTDRPDLVIATIEVENTSRWHEPGADRDAAMAHSLIAVHTLLYVDGGAFMSMMDPPPDAAAAVAGCRNDGTFPVLIGGEGTSPLVLSAPIILYDDPAVAPESEGDFCDATEIDEILALRVLTLTDEEKAEARGTDARSAAIIDRCDDMAPEAWARLHGTVRSLEARRPTADASEPLAWWDPGVDDQVDPSTDTSMVGEVEVGKGTRVRLRPSRRADAHDLFLAGQNATVAAVFHDVDGNVHFAVTLDDDPASELFEWQRRYLYFHPEEIDVLTDATARRAVEVEP